MYQSDLSAAGINIEYPDPAILKTPIGEALHDLATRVGAYTHKPHSVSQPASSPAAWATIIRSSLVRSALIPNMPGPVDYPELHMFRSGHWGPRPTSARAAAALRSSWHNLS